MRRLFSIGHSNHSLERFLSLLKRYDITLIVDTRSRPYSKFSPHFSADYIKEALRRAEIEYLFLGKELGGRPEESEFYDSEGHVLYWKLANSSRLKEGLRRLEDQSEGRRVAIMCSEEDPSCCHRRLLVGRVIASSGIELDHIRGSGEIQKENELGLKDKQSSLFNTTEKPVWRSIRSVLQREQRHSSSEH